MTKSVRAACALFASLSFSPYCLQAAAADVTIEVLNPRGEIVLDDLHGISPRLPDLAGKTIGLYANGKSGINEFLNIIESQFKQKHPTVTIKRYAGAFDVGDKLAGQIAKEVNAVVYGVGD